MNCAALGVFLKTTQGNKYWHKTFWMHFAVLSLPFCIEAFESRIRSLPRQNPFHSLSEGALAILNFNWQSG